MSSPISSPSRHRDKRTYPAGPWVYIDNLNTCNGGGSPVNCFQFTGPETTWEPTNFTTDPQHCLGNNCTISNQNLSPTDEDKVALFFHGNKAQIFGYIECNQSAAQHCPWTASCDSQNLNLPSHPLDGSAIFECSAQGGGFEDREHQFHLNGSRSKENQFNQLSIDYALVWSQKLDSPGTDLFFSATDSKDDLHGISGWMEQDKSWSLPYISSASHLGVKTASTNGAVLSFSFSGSSIDLIMSASEGGFSSTFSVDVNITPPETKNTPWTINTADSSSGYGNYSCSGFNPTKEYELTLTLRTATEDPSQKAVFFGWIVHNANLSHTSGTPNDEPPLSSSNPSNTGTTVTVPTATPPELDSNTSTHNTKLAVILGGTLGGALLLVLLVLAVLCVRHIKLRRRKSKNSGAISMQTTKHAAHSPAHDAEAEPADGRYSQLTTTAVDSASYAAGKRSHLSRLSKEGGLSRVTDFDGTESGFSSESFRGSDGRSFLSELSRAHPWDSREAVGVAM